MSRQLRWGILGTGNIARQFATGVAASRRCRVTAVASRRQASADAFARSSQVPTAYGDYDALLRDPDVDAVYVSLPNSMHCEWTVRALEAGKHVLCEKPCAMSVAETRRMHAAADRAGRLVMEAFMFRSHPQTHALVDAIRNGAIGQVRFIRTSFSFHIRKPAGNVRFNPDLGGGVLLDVGCYCVNFSRLIAGEEPSLVHAVATRHETGIDIQACGTLLFPSGVIASFVCGMNAEASNVAQILGTDGYIDVPIPWKPPVRGAQFIISRGTPPRQDHPGATPPGPLPPQTITVDAPTELYGMEADDFAAAVLDGRELPVTRQDTLGNMTVLEQLLRQVHAQWQR